MLQHLSAREEVAAAIAAASADESLDDPHAVSAAGAPLPRVIHVCVRPVSGVAVDGAAAAPVADLAVCGDKDVSHFVAAGHGGMDGHRGVQDLSLDDHFSSQSSVDSMVEVMHISAQTLEGRTAWDNYFSTSRFFNGLPPYFPEA